MGNGAETVGGDTRDRLPLPREGVVDEGKGCFDELAEALNCASSTQATESRQCPCPDADGRSGLHAIPEGFHFLEESRAVGIVFRRELFKLAKQFLLPCGQVDRSLDCKLDHHVATASTP